MVRPSDLNHRDTEAQRRKKPREEKKAKKVKEARARTPCAPSS
jgi:hypothetical protein